jgi:hypothetical protein
MKTSLLSLGIFAFALLAFSCQPQPAALTDAQKAAIADSAKTVVQEVFRGAQKLSGAAFIRHFSSDPGARYVENGVLFRSLDSLKASADNLYGMLESLTNPIDALDVVVLGAEAAAVTAPFNFTAKTKAGKEVNGQGVFSAVVQLRAGRWLIVQSHESELNLAELMAAMAPPKSKK